LASTDHHGAALSKALNQRTAEWNLPFWANLFEGNHAAKSTNLLKKTKSPRFITGRAQPADLLRLRYAKFRKPCDIHCGLIGVCLRNRSSVHRAETVARRS
jgi:hypothetical protein